MDPLTGRLSFIALDIKKPHACMGNCRPDYLPFPKIESNLLDFRG